MITHWLSSSERLVSTSIATIAKRLSVLGICVDSHCFELEGWGEKKKTGRKACAPLVKDIASAMGRPRPIFCCIFRANQHRAGSRIGAA